jgi:G3E family GTPase
MNKTSITVITGHLGSGKTTLIQNILNIFPDNKILVIENEFGEIGIDGEVLAQNKNALVELNSGCVCCNIQSDLEDILQKFIAEKHEFDHIIIEATGVANPAKIAHQFIEPSYLSNFFKLSSVLCVVDSHHYLKHKELPEFELQILTSDSFYLSKADNDNNKSDFVINDLHLNSKRFDNEDGIKDWLL